MIHYHGTPIGGENDGKGLFLVGRHAMVSWANPQDLTVVAEFSSSFVLDNGAFVFWNRREQRKNWFEFYEWVEGWASHPGLDWFVIPDVIDGSESENDYEIDQIPDHLKHLAVPVYHMHEPLERLSRLSEQWNRICIGSSGAWREVGSEHWWQRISIIMDSVCDKDGRPACKLHGLRMLSPQIFPFLPLASADSTNAAQNNNAKRIYQAPKAWQRAQVIAQRIEHFNSAESWTRQPRNLELI